MTRRSQQSPTRTAIQLQDASSATRLLLLLILVAVAGQISRAENSLRSIEGPSELVYTNVTDPRVPWSIHVVKVPRLNSRFEIQSRHAGNRAWGLSTLKDQIATAAPQIGEAVAAINGGFYRRDTAYAGAARGLQIVGNRGEAISAPSGSATFWMDLNGEPHLSNVSSQFQVRWPGGQMTSVGLNEERADNGVVLYTPTAGDSTLTSGGLELVLERQEGSRWLPLRVGRAYSARVRAVHRSGNAPLAPDIMVLSLGPAAMKQFQGVAAGATLQISTASSPSLAAARTALSAGPVLVRNGKRQKFRASPEDAYEFSSMLERHPRSAIGWNDGWFFLVAVDGRQRDVSVGMTLDELSTFLAKLGCGEALNLDGGGSATLWYEGEVRNNPCDGYERTIANSLVVLRKPARSAATQLTNQNQPDQTERSPAH